jgi:hypothetical protein
MSVLVNTFEVTVVVCPKGQGLVWGGETGRLSQYRDGKKRNSVYYKDVLVAKTETRMFHVEAKNHDQAFEKGKRYGRPVSARKVDRDAIAGYGNIEHLKLDQEPYGSKSVFQNAVAMDDLIWMKKAKRSERIEENKNRRTS